MHIPHVGIALALTGGLFLAHATNAEAQSAAADWSKAQTVQVGMTDYAFAPETLQFQADMPYDLRLTNSAGDGHSFDAPEFFAAVAIAPEDQSKVVKGEIEVGAGQTVEVKFTTSKQGTYEIRCSHFLHATFGMVGKAIIQ